MSEGGIVLRMRREGGDRSPDRYTNGGAVDSANNQSSQPCAEFGAQLKSLLATFAAAVGKSERCTLKAAEHKPDRCSQLHSFQAADDCALRFPIGDSIQRALATTECRAQQVAF